MYEKTNVQKTDTVSHKKILLIIRYICVISGKIRGDTPGGKKERGCELEREKEKSRMNPS